MDTYEYNTFDSGRLEKRIYKYKRDQIAYDEFQPMGFGPIIDAIFIAIVILCVYILFI